MRKRWSRPCGPVSSDAPLSPVVAGRSRGIRADVLLPPQGARAFGLTVEQRFVDWVGMTVVRPVESRHGPPQPGAGRTEASWGRGGVARFDGSRAPTREQGITRWWTRRRIAGGPSPRRSRRRPSRVVSNA